MPINRALALVLFPALAFAGPNIIFVMSDDHAIPALSAYDSKLISTPSLDRLANIHVPLGKASFEADKLQDNMATFIEAINEARPDVKGAFIRSVTITSTMGPAIPVDVNQAMALKPA